MSYKDFLSMEKAHRHKGGIDVDTGWRYEYWDVGMVRNATPENRKRMKVFLDPAPHVVMNQNIPLRGWYKNKHVPKGVRPRPCYTEAMLTQPYGGACPVRCSFCYVNNGVRGYRGQGLTVVDPAYPDKIRTQIGKSCTAAAFYISSFTEPFQVLEKHYHNTERLSQVAIDNGLPIFFLTRQIPPGWAMDALKKNRYSYQQFSINTPSPRDWVKFSPFAARLPELLNAVRECADRKIYVSVQCNPIMAGITTVEDVLDLIGMLKRYGTNHIIFKFVEIVSPAVGPMVEKAKRLFGQKRGTAFEDLFCETIGGVRTIAEEWRRDALSQFLVKTKKVKMTMSTCYEYGYEKDDEGHILSRAGISLGPEYTTSDQCHGKRIPVYSRPQTGYAFRPVKGCAPSGCLYCADKHGSEDNCPCNNLLLASAPALKAADYRAPAQRSRL